MRDLLVNENFADGILTLHLARDPTINLENKNEDGSPELLDIDDDSYIRFSLTKNNISDYGLSFLFEVLKDLVISKEFIETLYRVIIKVVRRKLLPIAPLPEVPALDADGNEPSEEVKQ